MSTKTTLLLPDFDKSIPNKVNEKVYVKSRHVLSIKETVNYHSAIATSGFSSKTDGVYVFAMKIDNIGNGDLLVGFTDVKTYDSKKTGFLGGELTGISLLCFSGDRYPGDVDYLSSNITRKAKEVVSILTISNYGSKKEIIWIVDGNDGPVQDCTMNFGNGDECFPCISLGERGQQVEFIPFDQIKSRSPKIYELMQEYKKPNIEITTSAPSTSTAANDALISQLRDQVGRSQDLLIQQSEKRIQQVEQQLAAKDQLLQQQNAIWQEQLTAANQQLILKDQQLSAKDQQVASANQQHERAQCETRESFFSQLTVKDQQQRESRDAFLGQIDVKDKQLELERAEHQKTRNLLHQNKMELKDMEIYYLMKEKESGQRRQREEENDQFKVKQEPSD